MRGGQMVLMGLLLGGCGSGGELADETQRRAAEQALDSGVAVTPPPVDSAYRVPAFMDGSVPAATADTGDAAPASSPQWTSGVSERAVPGTPGLTTVREMRVGRNTGFDRLVIGFGDDPVAGYRVEYVVRPVRGCGSGEPIPLAGEAALVVHLRTTQAHDDNGRITVATPDIRADMPVITQVKLYCDYEGEVSIALGVARAAPYRVLVEDSPNRLIVDLQQ